MSYDPAGAGAGAGVPRTGAADLGLLVEVRAAARRQLEIEKEFAKLKVGGTRPLPSRPLARSPSRLLHRFPPCAHAFVISRSGMPSQTPTPFPSCPAPNITRLLMFTRRMGACVAPTNM